MNTSHDYTVTTRSYSELESAGVIDSEFYEINNIDLTRPYALSRESIIVLHGEKVIGVEFSSKESAQKYIDSLTHDYKGFF